MIFGKKVNYYTELEIEEINSRLNSITEKFHTNSDDYFKFEGKIMKDEFKILPTFDYGPREQLRPEIIGNLNKKENITEIKLTFQLPEELKVLLIFAIILNFLIVTLMIGFPDLIDSSFWNMWWLILILIPVTFIILQIYFNSKINKSERILSSVLDMEQT